MNEASTSSSGRKPGPYKKFEDKGPRAQFSAVAAVHDQHEAGAILQAAPKAASVLGHAKLATAIRKMTKDPDVHPENALKGMNENSTYCVLYLYIFQKHYLIPQRQKHCKNDYLYYLSTI